MVPGRPRVLVVEDDRNTADSIRSCLEGGGYAVATAHDGRQGLQAALSGTPDLVVLDLLLPTLSGLEVCRALRDESSVPVILLTALSAESDQLAGLDLGADEYVTKPFSPRELVARVRAVLRPTPEGDGGRLCEAVTHQDLALDAAANTVTLDGREVRLTPTEFRLLEVLMRKPGRLFTRSQLVESVLGYDYDGMERTIDVHVLNLRRKIEPHPGRYQYILTIYGRGYKFGG